MGDLVDTAAFAAWNLKHVICRVPLTYTPMYWSLVFPLGMYALASLRLSLAIDFFPLRFISAGMVWVALGAWLITAVGLSRSSWRSFKAFARANLKRFIPNPSLLLGPPAAAHGLTKIKACRAASRQFASHPMRWRPSCIPLMKQCWFVKPRN